MVRLDPDRFLRLYREARAADISIGASDKPTQSAQFAALCKQFPYYTDFDLLRTREHVLYADALSSHTLEEIEAHYMHIVNYHALQCALDEEWNHHGSATSETDLDHLESYVPKIKDTRFKKRFRSAVAEFYARRSEDTKGRIAYETEALVVYSVFHFSEIRWGFYFKDTNEYGLYGLFVAHEGDREFESFYRSDRDFEAEEYLHDLVTDYEI